MKHTYLTKKDIDVARVLKQVSKNEIKEIKKCSKKRVIGNVILHDVA